MKIRIITALLTIILLCSSCTTMLLKMYLNDPKVENNRTIKEFQTRNNFSTENSLILQIDSTQIEKSILQLMNRGFYVFDSNGNHLCYDSEETCQGFQFTKFLEDTENTFKRCASDSLSLQKILAKTNDLNGNSTNIETFNKADYYVVSYWQKFLGGKFEYKQSVKWMEDELKKNGTNKKFTFIKINTDLQENWGLIPNQRAKLSFQRNGDNSVTIQIKELPFKK